MKIKFSHNYFKLHNQTKAELIDIKKSQSTKILRLNYWTMILPTMEVGTN